VAMALGGWERGDGAYVAQVEEEEVAGGFEMPSSCLWP
jgi:hypothetical protein